MQDWYEPLLGRCIDPDRTPKLRIHRVTTKALRRILGGFAEVNEKPKRKPRVWVAPPVAWPQARSLEPSFIKPPEQRQLMAGK